MFLVENKTLENNKRGDHIPWRVISWYGERSFSSYVQYDVLLTLFC